MKNNLVIDNVAVYNCESEVLVQFNDWLIENKGISVGDILNLLTIEDPETLYEINKKINEYKSNFERWCKRNKLTPIFQ